MAKLNSVSIRSLLALTLVIAICLGGDHRLSTWQVVTHAKLKSYPHEILKTQESEVGSEYSVVALHDLTTSTDRVFFRRRILVDYLVETSAVTPGCSVTFARRLKMTAGPFTSGRVEIPMGFADQTRILGTIDGNR